MGEVSIIGLDLAKTVFQAHGADASGGVAFRKKLRRDQLLPFFAGQPPCVVAMEACASAHYWAREIAGLGHETRLIPPAYVKPFVKRQKNDMADAEAICEAAQRPTMRFVAGKSAEAARAKADATAKRLMTIPGVGPITATALVALAPPASTFRRGRDFAAWLGLTPRQHSSGGKERLGRISKMGERSLRRLLILGASSAAKAAARDGSRAGPWLTQMLARKPRMLAVVALANKIARTVWALLAHGGSCRAPAAAA